AGSSFLRDRSPVTPKRTSTHGPAIRGNRRSSTLRSGLGTAPGITGSFTSASSLGESRSWLVRLSVPGTGEPGPGTTDLLPRIRDESHPRPGSVLPDPRTGPASAAAPWAGTAPPGR